MQTDRLTHARTRSMFVVFSWMPENSGGGRKKAGNRSSTPQSWWHLKLRRKLNLFRVSVSYSVLFHICAGADVSLCPVLNSSSAGALYLQVQWSSLFWGESQPGAAVPAAPWRRGCPSSHGCRGTTWNGCRWTSSQVSPSGWQWCRRLWLTLRWPAFLCRWRAGQQSVGDILRSIFTPLSDFVKADVWENEWDVRGRMSIEGLDIIYHYLHNRFWLYQHVCPQFGLYSAFMGGFIYTFLGTSKDVTLGPTAIMSLLCFSVVGGQPHRAVLLSLLCGLVQAAMALLRLGEGRAPTIMWKACDFGFGLFLNLVKTREPMKAK